MPRKNFNELRAQVESREGAAERLAALRAETLEEIRLYELRHAEAVSQVELAGRLEVTQGAISKLEHSDDVRVSTLRQYLDALGARLDAARGRGCVLRYVARLEAGGDAVVGLQEVPEDHDLANVLPTDSVVQFTTTRYRDNPLVVKGPGAGPDVTAMGIFADLLRVASSLGTRR